MKLRNSISTLLAIHMPAIDGGKGFIIRQPRAAIFGKFAYGTSMCG